MADAVIDLTGEEEAPKAVVPSAKRQRQAPVQKKKKKKSVWVLTKGDWPDHQGQKLVDVEVLGVFTSLDAAEQFKEDYLVEGGWEEGYGYHQGEDAESNIEIHKQRLRT